MTKWVYCGGDFRGDSKGPYPTEPGEYRVLVEGDSETGDFGHVFYAYDDYETWAHVVKDSDGEVSELMGIHEEEQCQILAWYGPIEIPECNLEEIKP